MKYSEPERKIPYDSTGAFCRHNHVALAGQPNGGLASLTFGVKDIYNIAETVTSFGNPTWFETHAPAGSTAPAVQRLLDAGASMVGRTLTDELAYSLNGENIHFGTPANPIDARRIPGGSSCGSASAVAAGLADFSLGTDCGGSVRLPASYCGILGIRPSLNRISIEGIVPFSSSFDVVGWFARDARVLADVGDVLFDKSRPARTANRLLIAEDAFAYVDPIVTEALQPAIRRISEHVDNCTNIHICDEGLNDWFNVFKIIQAAEIWANHGAWIETNNPNFGRGIQERMDWASKVNSEDVMAAREHHAKIRQRINGALRENDVLCLPSSPRIAPFKNTDIGKIEISYRYQAMGLLCISGLGGLPQISLPLTEMEGMPLGLSLIARHGNDEMLLELAKSIMQ